jgi:putative LysE/RhtB family amino acid efflux pump
VTMRPGKWGKPVENQRHQPRMHGYRRLMATVGTALAVGFGAGALVAAQVGPVTLLLVRTVLRGALLPGLALASAVALVDLLFAAAGLAGASALLAVEPLRIVLGIAGALVLVAIGARTLWSAHRLRIGAEAADEVLRPWPAFRTGFVATVSNPLTIASWAAVFAAAVPITEAAGAADDAIGTAALLIGVGLGSGAWYLLLTGALALVRRRIGRRTLLTVDVMSGVGLVGLGGALGWRSVAS